MKKMSLIIATTILVLSGQILRAQSGQTTTSAPVVEAANPLTFSPSVWTGIRSNLTGHISTADKESNTVGAFVKPTLAVKYKGSPVTVMVKYTFETSAAKGFGDGNATKSVANNTYYQHEPIFLISGAANDVSKFNLFGDLFFNTEHKRAQNTYYELTFQPDYEYQVTSDLSIAVGYQFFRKNYFDSTFMAESTSSAGFAAVSKRLPGIAKAASVDAVGQSPVSTLQSGIVTANVKLGEKSTLVASFRGGRQVSNVLGKTGTQYRFNADLSTPITQNLSAQLRYRYNLEDNDTAAGCYYNRVRAIVSYSVNKNWSADIQNQFTLEQKFVNTSSAKYINENYAGVTYKF